MTEFDEQTPTREAGIENVRRVIALYRAGDETMGIVSAYERAALQIGCTADEIERIWREYRST